MAIKRIINGWMNILYLDKYNIFSSYIICLPCHIPFFLAITHNFLCKIFFSRSNLNGKSPFSIQHSWTQICSGPCQGKCFFLSIIHMLFSPIMDICCFLTDGQMNMDIVNAKEFGVQSIFYKSTYSIVFPLQIKF